MYTFETGLKIISKVSSSKGNDVGCKKRVKGEKWGYYRNEKRKLFITRMFIYVRKKADALFSRTPAFSSSN